MLKNIIISRTDSIGDVVLTLPLAKVLKYHFPALKIAFLGKAYTRPVIEACVYVDAFIDLDDFLKKDVVIEGAKPDAIIHVFPVKAIAARAKELKIPLRIGTTNRLYHWTTCNKRVRLSRRKSDLHEAQLNLKLLQSLGIQTNFPLEEIGQLFGLDKLIALDEKFASLLSKNKFNLILHPKSQGSAREWGLDHFAALVKLLDKDYYQIFISGTANERASLQPLFDAVGDMATDISGMMSLSQFIAFINRADGLVAASTGPLHIAAALGKKAIGIYPPMRPIHPGRWAPLGPQAIALSVKWDCNDCRNDAAACYCIHEISALQVLAALQENNNSE